MRTLLSLFITFNFVALQAHGQADLPSNIYGAGVDDRGRTLNPGTTPKPASTPSTASSAGSGGATREGTGRSGGGSPSINPGARQGQGSQGSGMGANIAAGAGLIAAAIPMMTNPPTMPAGAAMLAMALLAIAQGLHQGDAAGQSGMTANSSWDGTGANGLGNLDSSGGSATAANPEYNQGVSNFAKEQSAKAIDALTKAGYSVEKDGLHTPSGNVIPKSAFSSPGAMAAAGIDATAVKAAEKILAEIEKDYAKYNVSGLAVDAGGGHGGSGSGSSSDSSDFSSAFAKYKNPFAISDKDKNQIVAGKTVLFDGEPIGVRGRNIFDMIHTAYQTKRTRNDFIEEGSAGAGGPSLRSPASVPPPRPASLQQTQKRR